MKSVLGHRLKIISGYAGVQALPMKDPGGRRFPFAADAHRDAVASG